MAGDAKSGQGELDQQGFLRGLGMAPKARLIEQLINYDGGGCLAGFFPPPEDIPVLMKESYENDALLSSNSWAIALELVKKLGSLVVVKILS